MAAGQQGLQHFTDLTATSSGGTVTYYIPGSTTIEMRATSVTFLNDGSSSAVRVNFTSTTGTDSGGYPVKAGETISINAPNRKGYYTGLSYTCTGVASVACRVIAIR